jgi:hypothetical protein
MVHLITFSLINYPLRDNVGILEAAIRDYNVYLKIDEAQWFIETDHKEAVVYQYLGQFKTQYDGLRVMRLHRTLIGDNWTDEQLDWLSKANFGSQPRWLAVLSALAPRPLQPVFAAVTMAMDFELLPFLQR